MVKIIISLLIVFSVGVFAPYAVAEKYGLDKTAQAAKLPNQGNINIAQQIGLIIGVVLSFIGVLFLILMIYAGFMWMMARGSDQEIVKAKGIMTAAIIGIVIIFSSYAITKLVLNNL